MNKLSIHLTKNEKLWGWIYYFLQLLILPTLITLVNELIGRPFDLSVLNFLYFGINFIVITLLFSHLLKENGKIALNAPGHCISSAVIGLFFYWGLSYAVQFFIVMMDPDFFNVNDASIGEMVQDNFVLTGIGTVLLVPIAEEALYRGLMFGMIYNRRPLAAYVISSCIFASVHVVGYIGSYEPMQLALCFIQYLPAGIAMGWAYARANSIWAPILMHTANNLISILAMR